MCEWGDLEMVRVKIPADLAATGEATWKDVGIDSCIAPIVEALQAAGIDMRGSCCGHYRGPGEIELQDGRRLRVERRERMTNSYDPRCKDLADDFLFASGEPFDFEDRAALALCIQRAIEDWFTARNRKS